MSESMSESMSEPIYESMTESMPHLKLCLCQAQVLVYQVRMQHLLYRSCARRVPKPSLDL